MPQTFYWICDTCNKYRVKCQVNLGLVECANCGTSPLRQGTADPVNNVLEQQAWDAGGRNRTIANANLRGGGTQYCYRVEHNGYANTVEIRHKSGNWRRFSVPTNLLGNLRGDNLVQGSCITPNQPTDSVICILNIHDLEYYSRSEVKKNRNLFNAIHGKAVKLRLGFQAGNGNSGFGLIHILCRHSSDIWRAPKEAGEIDGSPLRKLVKIICDVTDIRTLSAGCDQVFHRKGTNSVRYGFYGVSDGTRYLLVLQVEQADFSVVTLFPCGNIDTGLSNSLSGGTEIYKHARETGVVLKARRDQMVYASTREDLSSRFD